uniref:Mannosyltransferase n=1 Tax=Culex pipiens TaxID=7175 RepID=A0A8D8H0B6_CULPI
MVSGCIFWSFFLTRLLSAFFVHITDCDETYNYWEPVHYLLYGKGFQTWEYSPHFGLRSYLYLLLHAVPAWIIKEITGFNATSLFYCIRVMLAAVCAVAETAMYRSIEIWYEARVARMWLIFQLFSPGMFISSAAFLPRMALRCIDKLTFPVFNDNSRSSIENIFKVEFFKWHICWNSIDCG